METNTVTLKKLMENEHTKSLLDKALSTYPMYEPENDFTYFIIPNRSELNQKLLNRYKYREIGFETVGRFLDELEIAMNEIMPYYYQLFKSADIMNGIEDPFGNVDIVEKFEQKTSGKAEALNSSSSEASGSTTNESNMITNSKNVDSKTPQGKLLSMSSKDIDKVDYASDMYWNEAISDSNGKVTDTSNSKASGSSTSENEQTTSHTFTKQGNQGVNTYAHDMKELREVFMNIETKIIEDKRIAELFFLVY